MLRFGEAKAAKEKFYGAQKTTRIWEVNVDNVVLSKLIETKNNSKYLNGYLDEVAKPLVLIFPKMSGYVKTFKDKDGNKDNKLMSFHIDDEKQLKNCKAIWNKIQDLKNIKLNGLPVYDDRYIKTKIKTYCHKVYSNFRGINVPEDGVEYRSFTIISIDFLLVYENKYYVQVYLDNCAHKIVNTKMVDYLDDNLFETD